MDTHVITVTREFGSLGRLIARGVAEQLGYEYDDRDIIETAAEEIAEPVYELNEYDGHQYSKYGRMMFPLGYGIKSKQKKLFEIEKKVILDFATSKNCVIVGRCSDYILKEAGLENVYSVFIYAPHPARFNYCIKNLGLTNEAAEVYMEKVDKAREAFYIEHTGEKFHSLKYRNLLVDSSALPMEQTIDLICKGASMKFGQTGKL